VAQMCAINYSPMAQICAATLKHSQGHLDHGVYHQLKSTFQDQEPEKRSMGQYGQHKI